LIAALAAAPAAQDDPPKLVIDTQGFATMVNGLDFSPNGDLLAAAGADKVVRVWEVGPGRLKATLRGYDGKGSDGMCQAVAFSPDGRHLVVGVQDSTSEGAIRVYDVANLDEIQALLPGHAAGGVSRLEFSADGRYLASMGPDREILIWSWPDRRVVGRVRIAGEVYYVGFPSRFPLLVAFDGAGFHGWSAVRGKEVGQLTPGEWAELGPAAEVNAAVAAARGMGAVLGSIAFPYGGRVNSSRSYPARGLAAIGGRGTRDGRDTYWVGLWSTADGGLQRLYEGHRFTPSAEAVAPDGSLAASADVLGEVHVWDARTGATKHKFTARGKPVYKVGFSASGQKVGFGTRPNGPGAWGYNHYAELDRTFNLVLRRVDDGAPGEHLDEITRHGTRELTLASQGGRYSVASAQGGRPESRYPFPRGIYPMCYSFLRSTRPGFPDPVVFGRNDGSLDLHDPRTMLGRRLFIGHLGAVNAVGESPDGLLMVSGSDDRTIRFWPLSGLKQDAWPDFDSGDDSTVTYLIPGGEAERAGLALGDRFVKMDGKDVGYLVGEYLAGRWPYRVGQRVALDMERGGQPYRVTIPLVATGDFTEPLLSLFMTDEDWIIWTPQGYYDASPQGDRLIGWHVNRGRTRSARFYLAEQFRKQFYRPDVISRLIATGDAARAVREANASKPRGVKPLDLREPGVLASIEPPTVTLTGPSDGVHTRARSVTVSGLVESSNGLPLGDVKILVNGRPASGGKSVARRPGDTEQKRTVDRDVSLTPGLNTISVLASNRAATSRPVTVRVYCDEAPKSQAKSVYVLAVGISDYARPELKLNYAHRDAEAFAKVWKTQAGALYSDVKTRVLVNREATAVAIRDGMDWLRQSVDRDDLAVLFFSAHGLSDDDGGFFIATHELDPRRPLATGIANTEVIRLAEGLRSKVMVFIDTCHAGGMLNTSASREDAFRDLVSDQVGAVMFASSTPGGLSEEVDAFKHGAFTKAILDTLTDRNSYDEGVLTTFDMPSQLDRRVRKLTANRQQPVIKVPSTIGSFPFFHYAEGIQSVGQRTRPRGDAPGTAIPEG
jgi:WD40 repeat protein